MATWLIRDLAVYTVSLGVIKRRSEMTRPTAAG